MNFSILVASAFLTGLLLPAAEFKPAVSEPVNICMLSDSDRWIVTQAEPLAARSFAEIGIHIQWHNEDRPCKTPPRDFLIVQISSGAPDSREPGALAYSRPYAGSDRVPAHIQVFYNRIAAAVEPVRVPRLLAQVLAHEIAHMLEGTDSHSDSGVMKAHWISFEVQRMSNQPLSFTAADAAQIHRGLLQRQNKLSALAPAR